MDFLTIGLSVVSVLLGIAGIWYAFYIYRAQSRMARQQSEMITIQTEVLGKQNDVLATLKQDIFGSLHDFDSVLKAVTSSLKRADANEGSEVAMMCYWLWFGSDGAKGIDWTRPLESELDKLNGDGSEFFALVRRRIVSNHPTKILAMNPDPKYLGAFVQSLLSWRMSRNSASVNGIIAGRAVRKIISRYGRDVKELLKEVLKVRERSPSHAAIDFRISDAIPMLLFSARVKSEWSEGIIFLGESEALNAHTALAGFRTRDPRLVDSLFCQIDSLLNLASKKQMP